MGTLFVVATPIGNLGDMTPRAIEVLRAVSLIAAEDTRHSATLMRTFEIATPMVSYHQHNRASRAGRLLTELETGDVALISDAGTPAIADPGHDLVAAAIQAGHRVVPVAGVSSVIAGVCASGLVPGPFVFLGFLPRRGEERRVSLGKAVATGYPVVIFESPLRTVQTLLDVETVAPGRSAVVARELTKLHEEFLRGTVRDLADVCVDKPPRGEVVLVIGPATDSASSSGEGEVESLASWILAQGAKPSKAARELATITGIDAAAAYEVIRRIGKVDKDR